jgi:hypothetical protein
MLSQFEDFDKASARQCIIRKMRKFRLGHHPELGALEEEPPSSYSLYLMPPGNFANPSCEQEPDGFIQQKQRTLNNIDDYWRINSG